MNVEIAVAAGFDPNALLDHFAISAQQTGDLTWHAKFPTTLRGLAFAIASGANDVVSISGLHPVDVDGWADWSRSAPKECEMTLRLLPAPGPLATTDTVYRYDDAWVWDTSLPSADARLLDELGLAELSEPHLALASGAGAWAWKAIKLAWKEGPTFAKDPRVQAALWLTRQGWSRLQAQSAVQRARMEHQEFERRLILDLAEIRRARLDEQGSASSRRKARQYYSTLDALIAANN